MENKWIALLKEQDDLIEAGYSLIDQNKLSREERNIIIEHRNKKNEKRQEEQSKKT